MTQTPVGGEYIPAIRDPKTLQLDELGQVDTEELEEVKLVVSENAYANDLSKQSVTNSNKLLRAYYSWPKNHQLLLAAAISKVNPMTKLPGPGKKLSLTVRLSRNEIARLTQIELRNVAQFLDAAAKSFHSTPIHTPGSDLKVDYINVAERSRYDPAEDKFYITFHTDLLPEIINLSGNFNSYRLQHQASFNSKYTFNLYKACKSFVSGFHTFLVWDEQRLDNSLYFFLGLRSWDVGTKSWVDSSYIKKSFSRCKERIIEPAIAEINEKSDITLSEIQYLKTGRNVSHVRLYIKEKKETGETIRLIAEQGVERDVARYIVSNFGEEVAKRNCVRGIEHMKGGAKIRNFASYLTRMCKYDYAGLPSAIDPWSDQNKDDPYAAKFLDKVIVPVWSKLPEEARECLADHGLASLYIEEEYEFFCVQMKETGELRKALKSFGQRYILESVKEKSRLLNGA